MTILILKPGMEACFFNPVIRRVRQGDDELEASLGYTVGHCLKSTRM